MVTIIPVKKNAFWAVLSFILSPVFFSCHKSNDSNSGSGDLTGNWSFIGMTDRSQVSDQNNWPSGSRLTVQTTTLATTQSTGTLVFGTDSVAIAGMGYTYTDSDSSIEYTNNIPGMLYVESSSVFQPANSFTGRYETFGNDSVYIFGGIPQPSLGAPAPFGGRYVINNDTLIITAGSALTGSSLPSGDTTATYITENKLVYRLLRQ